MQYHPAIFSKVPFKQTKSAGNHEVDRADRSRVDVAVCVIQRSAFINAVVSICFVFFLVTQCCNLF